MGDVRYMIFASAGSAGQAFEALAERLGAEVVAMPDCDDVGAIADALLERIERLPRPRVLVGASLGAIVALECARRVDVDGLALIAAGFGVTVSDDVLAWTASNPPELLATMARSGLADRDDEEVVAIRHADFAARGPAVLLDHLQALAAHRPAPLADPPSALVLWGVRDTAVPLADHVELARRLRGALVPIEGAGHAAFLEQPELVAHWVARLGSWIHTTTEEWAV